jgi:hypothetical protein
MIYGWFVTSMIFYGLGLNAGSLAGDIFTNNALCAIFDSFAKVIFIINCKKVLRKKFFYLNLSSLKVSE